MTLGMIDNDSYVPDGNNLTSVDNVEGELKGRLRRKKRVVD